MSDWLLDDEEIERISYSRVMGRYKEVAKAQDAKTKKGLVDRLEYELFGVDGEGLKFKVTPYTALKIWQSLKEVEDG